MKKIVIIIFILTLFILGGCSCNSKKVDIYQDEIKHQEYLDKFYDDINTENLKYVAVDLRTKEMYETEHIRQFQNYDLSKGNIDELLTWLKGNYSSKYKIYIYIETLEDLTLFDDLLTIYSDVYIYVGMYDTIKSLGEELFTFDSGPYNCGC